MKKVPEGHGDCGRHWEGSLVDGYLLRLDPGCPECQAQFEEIESGEWFLPGNCKGWAWLGEEVTS